MSSSGLEDDGEDMDNRIANLMTELNTYGDDISVDFTNGKVVVKSKQTSLHGIKSGIEDTANYYHMKIQSMNNHECTLEDRE